MNLSSYFDTVELKPRMFILNIFVSFSLKPAVVVLKF